MQQRARDCVAEIRIVLEYRKTAYFVRGSVCLYTFADLVKGFRDYKQQGASGNLPTACVALRLHATYHCDAIDAFRHACPRKNGISSLPCGKTRLDLAAATSS